MDRSRVRSSKLLSVIDDSGLPAAGADRSRVEVGAGEQAVHRFQRIQIELTNRCNFKCEFCPDPIMKRERGDMDLGVLRHTVDQIVEDRLTDTVQLHVMGEPTLHRGLLEAVRYIKKRGLAIHLTTTGSLLNPDKMEGLLDSGVDHILFSAQTPDAESFSLRGVRMDFDRYKRRVVSSIGYALSRPSNTSITLSFLVTPLKLLMPTKKMSTIDDKRALTEHFARWLDDILGECSSSPTGRAILENRQRVIDGVRQMNMLGWNKLHVTEQFALETRVLGDWVHDGLTSDRIWGARYGSCEGLTEHLGILWNGDMVFCCVDYEGKTAFGNVKRERIATALQKTVVQKSLDGFRNYRVEHDYCKRCLGDRTLVGSAIRQIGSVLYFKYYRTRWAKRRSQGLPLVRAETSGQSLGPGMTSESSATGGTGRGGLIAEDSSFREGIHTE